MKNLLQVSHVNKSYGQQVVFQDLNFSIDSGHIVGLAGPNGCGKSTILKIIMGLIPNYDGAVLINGQHPGIKTNGLIAYLPETYSLTDFRTIRSAIQFYSDFFPDFDARKANELVYRFSLQPEQRLNSLTQGMRRRVELLLVLSRKAKLYLLDDPLKNLDSTAQKTAIDIILNHYTPESSVVIAANTIVPFERLIDTAILMGNGRIILNDNADKLRIERKSSIEDLFEEVFQC